jgi:TatD DNase family protein
MTPVPKRGQRNVPANVRYTAAFLATLRGETTEQLEAVTDRNAAQLFGLTVVR